MIQFITVAVFSYPHEIEILKHRLNMEEIRYFFENEATIGVMPMYSLAVGGIRLKIHPNDLEAVKLILSDLNDKPNLTVV